MTSDILHHKIYQRPDCDNWVVFVHGAGGSSSIWFKQIKEYKKHFNILLVDLRGHGGSANLVHDIFKKKYTFSAISDDIIRLLDYLNIKVAHFIGMSLGTIVIRAIAENHPERVKSMVLGGAITRLDSRSEILIKLGHYCKDWVPYMWLYKLFAYIIMPKSTHKESRHLFIKEAKKLCQKEFKRWFKLATEVNPIMKVFKERELAIPTLYIMGTEDYMFLKPVKDMVAKHRLSYLSEIPDCGHVCNIDKPDEFNSYSIDFIQRHRVI
ncbi:alpha/beta hydrolase [Vibrio sp. SS-MA-C1-2]|uniref:alpha/beta fold hydrolase n=1 Tax=Vibrio sp. SS-MA-C1-2 TaxID=2908646 RepID=UPI001F397017|nr:alpha/beta hydrolase [Vibrio sp. SS-MA-C1-2]UJF16861.1 alpha/beta hydrolase [Vibrio sp. SS-MA-C1-2]